MAKEYTTSQALAMLDKNKKLIFVRPNSDVLYIGLSGDYMILRNHQIMGIILSDCNSQTRWKLEQHPISITEAAEAFKQGKNIRCEFPSNINGEIEIDHWKQGMKNEFGVMEYGCKDITFYMLRVGKWYIDEEEE